MTVHVAIATTQGPVLICRLVEEVAPVMSLVCLAGTAGKPVSKMSQAYYDFVRAGSGLIEKDFGHGEWRLEIDRPIDAGESWQLGVYIAHWLHERGRLGDGHVIGDDEVVLVSGEVDFARNTVPVEHMEAKVAASQEQAEQWQRLGTRVYWLVHPNNADALARSYARDVSTIAALSDIPAALGEPGEVTGRSKSFGFGAALPVVALLGFGVLGLFFVTVGPGSGAGAIDPAVKLLGTPDLAGGSGRAEQPISVSTGEGEAAPITLRVLTSEEAWLCDSENMAGRTLEMEGGRIEPATLQDLCGLLASPSSLAVAESAYLFAHDTGAFQELAWSTARDRAGWWIPKPTRRDQDRQYSIVLLENTPDEAALVQLEEDLQTVVPLREAASSKIKRALEKQKLAGRVYEHELLVP